MIHETCYTLSEAFDLIGRHLHGDVWIGGEAGVVFCCLNEDDIAMLRAGPEKAVEKAVEPNRIPGGSVSDGEPENIMRILDHAHDEYKGPYDITMAAVLGKKWLEEGIAEEIARVEQLIVDEGFLNFKHLWGPAKDEALWRLRAGDPLTERRQGQRRPESMGRSRRPRWGCVRYHPCRSRRTERRGFE